MRTAQKYISDSQREMRSRWNNMTGASNLSNTPANRPNRPNGWSAQGGGNAMPAGSPKYIIQVSNSSNATFSGGFDVFGASQYLFGNFGGGTWSANGSLTINGITISSLYTTVSYQQVLSSSNSNSFMAGGVYLQLISGSTAQVSDIYTVNSQDAGGKQYLEPIKPYIDPNQFQNGITYNNASFNMDGLTKLTWSNIYASTVFQISIFPAVIINPTQALNQGGAPLNQYGQPKVIGNLK